MSVNVDELNEAQRQAVVYNDGPALVIAGAGSGKTRVITHKLASLIELGYPAQGLFALTFTNKAAREMSERVQMMVGPEMAYKMKVGTFHSIFSKILRRYASVLGYTSEYSILDTTDSKGIIRRIVKNLNLDDSYYPTKKIQNRISSLKNNLILAPQYLQDHEALKVDRINHFEHFGKIYSIYVQTCKSMNAMDFDDILLQFNILLRDFPEQCHEIQNSMAYLLVDEYQDTNISQFLIVKRLVERSGRIFAVGDDAQSIYAFRGANLDNILSFTKVFDQAKIFRLEQNYRSTQNIVNIANGLIEFNSKRIPKTVFSDGAIGDKVKLFRHSTAYDEADRIVKDILVRKMVSGSEFEQQAILYRTNAQSRLIEDALRRSAIPYVVYGALAFYSRQEIKDLLSYLYVITNPYNNEALVRSLKYPRKGIGDKTILKITDLATELSISMMAAINLIVEDHDKYAFNTGVKTKLLNYLSILSSISNPGKATTLFEWMQQIVKQTGIVGQLTSEGTNEARSKLDNIEEFISSTRDFVQSYKEDALRDQDEMAPTLHLLSEFTRSISLMTDQDEKKKVDQKGVGLMTIHASKGLEFKHVYISGIEENLLPSSMSREQDEVEEERRLLYVAITRAKETCDLHYADIRRRNGKDELMIPSRFIKELDNSYIESIDLRDSYTKSYNNYSQDKYTKPESRFKPINKDPSAEAGKHVDQIGDLIIGGRVRHNLFGLGVIKSLVDEGKNSKAVVHFDDGADRTLLICFAKLVVVD